jgi:hypothetical protein
MQKAQSCPLLGIDESTWKIERSVLSSKEAVEEAKADLKAVQLSYTRANVQVRYLIARLLVDFTKEESEQKLSRRLVKALNELEKYEEQERQLLVVYYAAREDYLSKLQNWRLRLTAVLSKQEETPPKHLGLNGILSVYANQ